jgi:hypothetical protein
VLSVKLSLPHERDEDPVPWHEIKGPLSAKDKEVIAGVREACHELLNRLSELDEYVDALNTAVDHRRHEGGPQ